MVGDKFEFQRRFSDSPRYSKRCIGPKSLYDVYRAFRLMGSPLDCLWKGKKGRRNGCYNTSRSVIRELDERWINYILAIQCPSENSEYEEVHGCSMLQNFYEDRSRNAGERARCVGFRGK